MRRERVVAMIRWSGLERCNSITLTGKMEELFWDPSGTHALYIERGGFLLGFCASAWCLWYYYWLSLFLVAALAAVGTPWFAARYRLWRWSGASRQYPNLVLTPSFQQINKTLPRSQL